MIDELSYADEGDWADRRQVEQSGELGWEWRAPFDGQGRSLELINPFLTNAHGQNWASSLIPGGTPGALNTRHQEASAPLIGQVRHHPAVPGSREPVVVRATLESAGSVPPVVTLHYRISEDPPSTFRQVAMVSKTDDDVAFAGEIPPHLDGTVIEFYVRARANGLQRTWPAPSDDSGTQGANALYQVDDSFAHEDVHQPYYRLVLTAEEDRRFRPENFPAGSDAEMNATFIASRDGETSIRYRAGLRRRGNGSRGRDPRSFRLNLPSDAPWRSATALNLVAQYNYLQVLGMHLFKAAHLSAPEAFFVQLRLNGVNYARADNRFGVHYGSYAHLQPLDSDFVREAFPDDPDGDLYRKISANPSRDRKRWGVHFENQVVYQQPNWY